MALIERLFGAEAGMARDPQFGFLVLANVNAVLGTVVVSPLLETLTGPFGVSSSAVGLLMTAYTVPPIVGIPVVGMLADRYGRRPVLVAGLALFGLSGASVALTTDFRIAVVLRMLQGMGFAGIVPVVVTAIGDSYEGATEATAQGLRFTSSGISQAVFPPLAGVLVGLAWQFPFAIYLLSLPTAAVVALGFEETSRNPGEADHSADAGRGSYAVDLLRRSLQPTTAFVLLTAAVPSFAFLGFLTFVSFLVVRVFGGSPGVAGLLIAVTTLVYAGAASQAGRVSDRFDSRLGPLVVAVILVGFGLVLVGLAPSLPVVVLGVAVLGVGIGQSFALLRSVVTSLADERFRGGLVGVLEAVIRLATSVAPLAMGWAIAILSPSVGAGPAIRYTFVAVGAGCAVLGTASLLAARAAPSPAYGGS